MMKTDAAFGADSNQMEEGIKQKYERTKKDIYESKVLTRSLWWLSKIVLKATLRLVIESFF